MDEQTKEKLKTDLKRPIAILLLLVVVAIVVAFNRPGSVARTGSVASLLKSDCHLVEEDALNIKAALSDHFADPAHTDLNINPSVLADKVYVNNPWTLKVGDDNISIHVVDSSGKCSAEYQERYPEWHSGIYTLKFLD